MKKDLLHTPEGVRDIYSTECAEKKVIENRRERIVFTMSVHHMAIMTYRHLLLNSLMYSIKNVEVYHLMKCSSFLTDMATL